MRSVLFAFIFVAVNSFAQQMKIGYIDFQKVVLGYEKAQEREKVFKKEIEEEQAKINKMKEKLKSSQQEYAKKKDLMKPEEITQKENQLKEQYKELANLSEDTNQKLRKKQSEFEQTILKEIRKATGDYAEKNKYNLILNGNAIFYPWEGIDVTDEIIKFLNKSK